jgi:hypothetical protein
MNSIIRGLAVGCVAALPAMCSVAGGPLTVKVTNQLPLARLSQTIELSAADLAPLGEASLQKIHVKDASGKELLCQAVDTNFDPLRQPDSLIFQADLGPGEMKTFVVFAGAKQVYTKEQFRAHGRFVRERFDDFAWENDRIAHRMYGKGLETWAGEPLTSSTVDIWSKRVPQMVIDEWYMVDNYHSDTGQGADFYSAGKSRGCGGNGLWADEKLWLSRNFVDSRVLANGPLRVMFELVYEPFDVNGLKISEVKRITLDAGSHLDHFESYYKAPGDAGPLTSAVGLKKVEGEQKLLAPERGWVAVWQKMEKGQGMQGLALVADPKAVVKITEDKLNNLLLVRGSAENTVSYWSGFAWDKAGQFTSAEAWKKYVAQFARSVQSPLEIRVQTGE